MPTSAEKVRQGHAALATMARREVAGAWLKVARLPTERIAPIMTDLLMAVADKYGTVAGSIAADYYDELRVAAGAPGRFTPEVAALPDVTRFEALARWGVSPLFAADPNPAKSLSLMSGGLSRIVLGVGRDTIADAVSADPTGPRYARHASANACAFCALLATRGAVYSSPSSAGVVVGRGTALSTNIGRTSGRMAKGIHARGEQALGAKYHDDCHCTSVPVWPGQNYDEAPYVKKWRDAYANAPAEPGEAIDLKKTLSSMRTDLDTN